MTPERKLSGDMLYFIASRPPEGLMDEWIKRAEKMEKELQDLLDSKPVKIEVQPHIDYEAIAWAYQKLCNFGVVNSTEQNALMADRLNLMLLQAPEVEPELTDGYEVGVTFMDRIPQPIGNL